ncbi:MAG: hypothetical protein K0S65_5298 [Labilithrix sp.]|nr:hypothetical protein [Labilithrix sp.]
MNPAPLVVGAYTPRGPYSVGPNEPLANARHLMEKYEIEELPVRTEGKLVGLVSERDLRLVWALMHPPPTTLTVEDAMKTDPYAVTPDTALDQVIRVMTDRRLDAAVVVEGGRVVGVFTAVDAMHALADLLEGKLDRVDARARTMPPTRRRPSR